VNDKEYSPEVAGRIDAEVSRIMSEAREKAENILTKYRSALDSMSKKLIEVETLEQKEFEDLLILNGIEPKKDPNKSSGIIPGDGLEIVETNK